MDEWRKNAQDLMGWKEQPKLKWQTGEPPEGELVIFEVDTCASDRGIDILIGKNYKSRMVEEYMDKWTGWAASDVSRWVLYSDFLKVIE